MKHQLRFGDGKIEFSLAHEAETLLPQEAQPLPDPDSSVRKALDNPKVGPKPLTYILPQGGLVFPWVKSSR
jgi:hypothetical protein